MTSSTATEARNAQTAMRTRNAKKAHDTRTAKPKASTRRLKHTGKVAAKAKPAAPARAGARATEAAQANRTSSRDAAAIILRDATGPMKVADIARQIVAEKLAPGLKGKTPEATIGAQLYTACKGTDSRFVKVDRGLVDLRELNPRGAKKRPAAKAS